MATPTPVVYKAPSGKSVRGGIPAAAALPAWRAAMAPNTWIAIPGNTLSDVDPAKDPLINPNTASTAPWKGTNGQAAVVTAYNGAVWDEDTGTLWEPLQGGHNDYGGNEGYKNQLASESPSWSLAWKPSGAIGNLITLDDAQETSGLYSDGHLRSVHSYNNNEYVPGVGPVVTRAYGPYKSGNGTLNKVYKLNESTGDPTLICDYSAMSQLGTGTGGCCYDKTRHCLWMLGVGTARLLKIDLATGTGTRFLSADNYAGGYLKMIHMPDQDLLAVFHSGGTGYKTPFFLIDLANAYAIIQPTVSGAWSAGISTAEGVYGAGWDGTKFLLWDNASNTTEVSTLTPSGDPRTQEWVMGVHAVAAGNAVTPTVRSGLGTWGRFGYSKKLKGCYLLNGSSQPVYFFATE